MRVLHVLPTRAPEYGGPIRVAEALCRCIVQAGHSAEVYPSETGPGATAHRFAYWPGVQGLEALHRAIRAADLVHVHGLWTVPTSAAAVCARSAHRPFVVTPHGMLDRWSLRHNANRKRVYAALIERQNLEAASALHFFNQEELNEARDFGVRAPTFLLPNGVDVEEFVDLPNRDELERRYPSTKGRKVFLFLGRIHPKKGLPLLVQAFARLAHCHSEWQLVIAGPDEGGHTAEIAALVARHGLAEAVVFCGPVFGADKRALLGGADVFVLPSHQEGDSVAIKEALAAGLPVVITRPCHFSQVAAADAGLVVDPVVEELYGALRTLASDDALRRRMASNARPLIERYYRWDLLGARLISQYEQVLARNPSRHRAKPES